MSLRSHAQPLPLLNFWNFVGVGVAQNGSRDYKSTAIDIYATTDLAAEISQKTHR